MKDRLGKLTEENETLKAQVERLKTMIFFPGQVLEELKRLNEQQGQPF
jgi:cell division protein FtsB